MLSQYGIERLPLGSHTLALRIGDVVSNELSLFIVAAKPKLSLSAEPERFMYGVGEEVTAALKINNLGTTEIDATETFWSARLILDGKVYRRRVRGPWSGVGIIPPNGSWNGAIRLSEFGIQPETLAPGEHTFAIRIGDAKSNAVQAGSARVSLEIESKPDEFAAEKIAVTVKIKNLEKEGISAPLTLWSISIVLDGNEYQRLPKFIGTWNGPGIIIADGVYQGGIELSEYGVEPAARGVGKHKLALKLGDVKSNEIEFTIEMDQTVTLRPRG